MAALIATYEAVARGSTSLSGATSDVIAIADWRRITTAE
jgi:hypothetical protein